MVCNIIKTLCILVLSVFISACSLDANIVDISQVDLRPDSELSKKYHESSFVTKWKLNSHVYGHMTESYHIGLTEHQLQLPLVPGGQYDFIVKWGDGTESHITSWDDPAKRHTYAEGKMEQGLYVAIGRDARLASDGTYLFISDRDFHTIKKIEIATQKVSTIYGVSGHFGSISEEGENLLYHPEGIATDGTFIYVGDTRNYVVRKINIQTNEMVILAGSEGQFGNLDGVGSSARFLSMSEMVVVGSDLFVLDFQSLRKINILTGTVSTVINSNLNTNSTLAFDENNIYIFGDGRIQKFEISTGTVTTLAGSSAETGFINGSALDARFSLYAGGIYKKDNFLYILDSGNRVLRKFNFLTQQVTTVAGQYDTMGYLDGAYSEALFTEPRSLVGIGNDLYIIESMERAIRKLSLQTETVSTYAGPAIVTIEMTGEISQLSMVGEYYSAEDDYLYTDYFFSEPYMLVDVVQWGTNLWKDMSFMFYRYGAAKFSATDDPNTREVVSMKGMFANAISFDQRLNFDTRNVKDMSYMLANAISFDQRLNFDTRNVKDMSYMLADTEFGEVPMMSFNQPLNFDTSSVEKMTGMFLGAYLFNQPLNFDTHNVKDMSFMFSYAGAYNQALPSSFDTSNVTNMSYMFSYAGAYNQALPSSFDTSKVTDMVYMFNGASSYNQALPSSFNTSKVTNMSYMFQGASSYNQALPSSFDTSKVTNMSYMFQGASSYNQNLKSILNVCAVTAYTNFATSTPNLDTNYVPAFGDSSQCNKGGVP